jgi:hypothetical protein
MILGKNIDQHYITDLLGYPTSASLGAKAKKTQERLEGAINLKKKKKKKSRLPHLCLSWGESEKDPRETGGCNHTKKKNKKKINTIK